MLKNGLSTFDIFSPLPLWLILLLGFASFFIAYLTYSSKTGLNRTFQIPLFILRALSLLFITLLLANLVYKSRYVEKEPFAFNIYLDISKSTNQAYDQELTSKIQQIARLYDGHINWERFLFASGVSQDESIVSDTVFRSQTDLSKVLDHLSNSGADAAVVISDGIQNLGVESSNLIQNIETPIFTTLLGDTLSKPQLNIIDVVHPNVVFEAQPNPIRTVMEANELATPIDIRLESFDEKKNQWQNVTDTSITANPKINRYSYTYTWLPKLRNIDRESEQQRYRLIIESTFNDNSSAFDEREFIIQVKKRNIQVLFETTELHPDVGAVKRLLSKQAEFNVYSDSEEFNSSASVDLDSIDLWINHGKVPTPAFFQSNAPAVFIQSHSGKNSPTFFADLEMDSVNARSNLLFEPIDATAINLPPLRISPRLAIEEDILRSYDVFYSARIKEINQIVPIVLGTRTGIYPRKLILTADMWYSWINYPDKNTQNYVEQWILKWINWTLQSTDDDTIRKLDWPEYWTAGLSQSIRFQVLNELQQTVSDVSTKLIIESKNGEFSQTVFPQLASSDIFQAQIQIPASGVYSLKLQATNKDGVLIGSLQEDIFVQPLKAENPNQPSKIGLMRQWATLSGGSFLGLFDNQFSVSKLDSALTLKNFDQVRSRTLKSTHQLSNWNGWFILILILLTLEWVVRRVARWL